jgi:hypothetical protein
MNREWFTRGALAFQYCRDCSAFQHPPEEICTRCQGQNVEWRECAGAGRVESVAVVHQGVHPGLKESVPYSVVVVSIDAAPGVHAIGNVINCPPRNVEIGQRVRAVFESAEAADGTGLQIPQWELVADQA